MTDSPGTDRPELQHEIPATESERKLSTVDPSKRVLLLSQCLRPSQTCPGRFTREGLECPQDCAQDCVIRRFKEEAAALGYSGVCVAAGGAMALRFVRNHEPQGIVAVACDKELVEGVEEVQEMTKGQGETPAIVVVPLLRDGCVDTEVDAEQVLKAINLGPEEP